MSESEPLVAHQHALVPAAWITAMQMVAQGTCGDPFIVIRGERGTGKDLLARMLHTASGRAAAHFMKVDCATRPAGRLASQLFGHERGASPDAGRRRLGAVEFAHRGTLFLDNIDALPPSLQPDVLAYLQGVSVGSARGRCVPSLDVRTLMATRGSLGSGRDELRLPQNSAVLSVLDFQLAPLRARPGHIAPLAEFFLARFNAWYGRDAWLPREGLRRLTDYAWPGNVRELKGEIRRFVLSAEPRAVAPHIGSRSDGTDATADRRTA
jgi:DNA-binding NtrC family response regulator